LSGHQRITWRRNIAENFNRLSRVHERYRRQTTDDRQTDRQTDGRRHIANMNMSSRSLKSLQTPFKLSERATSLQFSRQRVPYPRHCSGRPVSTRLGGSLRHRRQRLPIARLASQFGIHSVALQWFRSYLQNRSFRVVCGGSTSTTIHTVCSVPQGSILGPRLFILYKADLAEVVKYYVNNPLVR